MTKREEKSIANKVRRYLKAKENGQRGYKKADALMDELAEKLAIGEEVKIDPTGRRAKLIDLFAKKNVVFKPCGVRRYDLEITEGEL